MKNHKEIIEGTMVPISWERSGEVKRVSIYTDEEEDIILNHHYPPQIIKSLLNKRVKVFGLSMGISDGCKLFSVSRIVKNKEFEGRTSRISEHSLSSAA